MTEPDRHDILREVYEENKRVKEQRFEASVSTRRTAAVGILGIVAVAAVLLIVFGVLSFEDTGRQARGGESGLTSEFRVPVQGGFAFSDSARFADGELIPGDLDALRNSEIPLAELFDLEVRRVVIDPGHGGRDPGALGKSGLLEKDITLDVSSRLARRLREEHDLLVDLTRTSDSTLTLRERVEFANASGADLFVSVHVNYFPSEPVYALETYYFGAQSNEAALEFADKENRNSDYTVVEFNRMVQDFSGELKLQESRRLARHVQQSLIRNTRRLNEEVDDWGIKSAPFVVLLGSQAPGILVEIGVISNEDEEAKLATSEYREQLATFLEEGIVTYLGQTAAE